MADEALPASPLDKPLPDPNTRRPGTSRTELNLRANRQKASLAFQRAARAEASYRAKRQAKNARRDVKAAKAYYKEGLNQLKLGTAYGLRAVKAIPAVLGEKREGLRERREERERERAAEKKRMWEEKAKGKEEGAEASGGSGEGEEDAPAVAEV